MEADVRLIAAAMPRLRRYARALLRDEDRAEDLVQETFLRGLDRIHQYHSGTNLRAWLFTIMHNQYVNSVRRAVRQGQTSVVEEVHLVSPASQLPSLELRDLESAIARLPAEQRAMLLLITLEGMKYQEVARICGVPIGTVRSRLSRVREELRRMTEGASPNVEVRRDASKLVEHPEHAAEPHQWRLTSSKLGS